jgi:RNA polymerase sigma-70 factor (ECF subfamily)
VKSKLYNKDIAEDILQEIFIKAYKKYDDYNDQGKLKCWLMRIAHNTVKNYFWSKENKQSNYLSLDDEIFDNPICWCFLLY